MPVRKASVGKNDGLRAAGVILRRKLEKEFHTYIPLPPYQPEDYEVLLRRWPSPPFLNYLAAFSGPAIIRQSVETTLLQQAFSWSRTLGERATESSDVKGIHAFRASFLSMHGGGRRRDPLTREMVESGVVLCYALPTTNRDSSIVSRYPLSPDYPHFHDLSTLLSRMTSGSLEVHPLTREMLSSLDHWLKEQHSLPRAIHLLFSPSLHSRLKMYAHNPLFAPPTATPTFQPASETASPNSTVLYHQDMPLLSSTPFPVGANEESTLHNTTAFSLARLREREGTQEREPADLVVRNPLFGSGLQFSKVDIFVSNKYYEQGQPDYDALGTRKEQWRVEIHGDGLPDWIDLFPLHKCACEGDVEGVRRCIRLKVAVNETDTDSWTPLHYACWYGELQVVRVLVEEASASLGVRNSSDSTPLHLAAATGHTELVRYLLEQRTIAAVMMALDSEGKSPLAVCLECRMNDWRATAQLLKEAYKNPSPTALPHSPSLLSYSLPADHASSPGGIPAVDGSRPLGCHGSQPNLAHEATPTSHTHKTVRRQRVDFMSGQHQLAHFFRGKDTPTTDVLQGLYKLVSLPPSHHNLLALWIVSESMELQLGDTDKPLQLLSSWSSLLTRQTGKSGSLLPRQTGKSSPSEVPKLFLRRNVFFSVEAERSISDPVALEMLYHDAQKHVLTGYYPCSEEDAIYLAGITMQVAYGDHNPLVHQSGFLREQLSLVLPGHMTRQRKGVELERRVLSQHSQLSRESEESDSVQVSMYLKYLEKCWQWPFYGGTFFHGNLATKLCRIPKEVKLVRKAHTPVCVAVNTRGFHLVSKESNTLLLSLAYDRVEWDVSLDKKQLLLFRKDKSLHIPLHIRNVSLLHSLVTRLTEQYVFLPTSPSCLSDSLSSS